MIVRKSNIEFGDKMWSRLIDAVEEMRLWPMSVYGSLAEIHPAYFDMLHGSPVFLPWHRVYLILFERELRRIDPTLSLPYWDWDEDRGRMRGFRDYKAAAARREVGRAGSWPYSSRSPWSLRTSTDDFGSFSSQLEADHDSAHVWIGGDMRTHHSPRDIAFWLHHAAVDRVWATWQEQEGNEHKQAPESPLEPWAREFTVGRVNNIAALGADSYTYE